MSDDHTRGHTCIRRNGFMPGIAGDDVILRIAHNSCDHERSGRVTVIGTKLSEAGSVAVHHRAGRDPVDEIRLSKALGCKRAWKRRRSSRHDLCDAQAPSFDIADNREQFVISGTRRGHALGFPETAILPVVIMQSAEFIASAADISY